MLQNNFVAMVITLILALGWLRIVDWIAHRGWVTSKTSRKIIHITTGPLFVLCWLLFNERWEARWLAALVPLGITLQFILVGVGAMHDDAAVKAMSRTGDRREILRGPLYYGLVFVIFTLVFWKESPVGIVALMMMCGGDGLADVIGRKAPLGHLPWSKEKSYGGSLAVLIGGFLMSLIVIWIFVLAGIFPGPTTRYLPGIILIAIVGTVIESLPFHDIDNITVSLASVLVGLFVF
jgi:phytol kinase